MLTMFEVMRRRRGYREVDAHESDTVPWAQWRNLALVIGVASLGLVMMSVVHSFSSHPAARRTTRLHTRRLDLPVVPPRGARRTSKRLTHATEVSSTDTSETSVEVVVPFVIYPKDWFLEFGLFDEDGYGPWFLSANAAEGVSFNYTTYSSEEYETFLEDIETFEAGTVIMFATNNTVNPYVWNSSSYRKSNQCVYCWGESNRLLYQNMTQKILSTETPFTLIYSNDWCCQVTFPETTHQILRTEVGTNVMDNVAGTYPFGLEWYNSTDFVDYIEDNPSLVASLPSTRLYAFSFAGTVSFRKPSRVHFKSLIKEQQILFDDIMLYYSINANQSMRWIVDAPELEVANYTYEDVTGLDYTGLLVESAFALVPAGDAFWGGRLIQALELGAIPVVEEYGDFKGCENPIEVWKELGAPFIYMSDWRQWGSTVNEWLADLDALDDRALEVRTWWESYKTSTVARLSDFYIEAQQGLSQKHTCTTEYPSAQDNETAWTVYEDYFSNDDWFSNFTDSPWYCGAMCGTTITDLAVNNNTACFSEDCAPRPTMSFTCRVTANA